MKTIKGFEGEEIAVSGFGEWVGKDYIDYKFEYKNNQKVIKELFKENQELKKQLDNQKNKYKNRLNNQLAEVVEPDFEDFYLAEIEGKSNEYDELIIKQKEFIEYLKDKEKQFDVMGDPINSGACLGILRKYKEIIGDKDE